MSNESNFANFEEMLPIRMAPPDFSLQNTVAMPDNVSDVTQVYINDLLDLGFIYSHEIIVQHAVGKPEGGAARMLSYIHVDENIYALVTDLYHVDTWVNFTNYYPQGSRIITTNQPGALLLDSVTIDDVTVQNSGSATVDSQWKKHRRLAASLMPEETAVIFKPDQHLAIERSFYLSYVQQLLANNILQQSDTQIVRFTRSGARAYQLAITSRSSRRPQPNVEQWIGKRGKLPLRQHLNLRNGALAASALAAVGLISVVLQNPQSLVATLSPQPADTSLPQSQSASRLTEQASLETPPLQAVEHSDRQQIAETNATPLTDTSGDVTNSAISEQNNRQQLTIATNEDEIWRIAVENAEFFLMSNDGDPSPWIRTARKIAAGFKSDDSRLGRTYFLTALLEPDYRVAEQQYNRALSIQTKSLGLYHAETAQTLEALAWIAEHNKEALDEAITHQRLAINIYRDIFGADAEDTKAAEWKLEYFEDRLAGIRPKSEGNNRLLPALAKFGR